MKNQTLIEIKDVTFFLASLEGGGIQKATMRLLREFNRRGFLTTLVVANGDGPTRANIPAGTTLIDLHCPRVRNAAIPLIKYLLKEKPHTGISSQTHLNVLIILLRILCGYPKRLIVREHNTFVEENIHQVKSVERLRPSLIRIFYPYASRFVAVSGSVLSSIKKYAGYKNDIRVIPNGLNLDEICELKDLSINNPWESHYQGKKLIVSLGRLTNQKNQSLLIQAFSLLADLDAHLLVMGDGEELNQLKELSKKLKIIDRVDFTGFVENPYPILSKANVFVLPSKWEGFCNVVIEALACGIPIVSTDCPGGPADILEDKPFARIVPIGNPGAMADAINVYLTAKTDKTQITEYSKLFNISEVCQQYIDLMNDLG